MKVKMELLRVDVPDDEGDVIARATALRMIDDFKLSKAPVPVKRDYKGGVLGRVLSIFLEGDRVMAELVLSPEGHDLVQKKYEAALGGKCERLKGDEHSVFTSELIKIELTDVALTDKKVRYG